MQPPPNARPSYDDLLSSILDGHDTVDHDDLATACGLSSTSMPGVRKARRTAPEDKPTDDTPESHRWRAVVLGRDFVVKRFPSHGSEVSIPTSCPLCDTPSPIVVHVRSSSRALLHTRCSHVIGELTGVYPEARMR